MFSGSMLVDDLPPKAARPGLPLLPFIESITALMSERCRFPHRPAKPRSEHRRHSIGGNVVLRNKMKHGRREVWKLCTKPGAEKKLNGEVV